MTTRKRLYKWLVLLLHSSVQFSHSVVSDSLQPHGLQHARPPCPSPTPRSMSIESMMPSSHLILCRPLLLLPQVPPSIRVFSNESTRRMRWPKYWSFSFNISPSNEYPGLISFRIDWLDLLAVQGTPKSLLQHHSSKASILWCSAFFTVQLAHPGGQKSCEERGDAMKYYKDTRDVPWRREKREINISWTTKRGFLKKVTSELGLEIRL